MEVVSGMSSEELKARVTAEVMAELEKAGATIVKSNYDGFAELSKALEAKGVETLEELQELYYLEEKKEAYKEAFGVEYWTKSNFSLLNISFICLITFTPSKLIPRFMSIG